MSDEAALLGAYGEVSLVFQLEQDFADGGAADFKILCPVGITTQDEQLAQRLMPDLGAKRLKNYLKTLNMELTTLARACGKQNVHHLEREDLAAMTIEAAAMARLPLAGTDWVPGL